MPCRLLDGRGIAVVAVAATSYVFSVNAAPAVPTLNNEVLWLDASNASFYAYNGAVSLATDPAPSPPQNSLWQFTPHGDSGTWSSPSLSLSSSNFTSLVRTQFSASTSGNGLGFALGGIGSADRTLGLTDAIAVPDMVIYNSTSQAWYNVSATGYSEYGTTFGGASQFVPSFGPAGLLFALGGEVAGPGTFKGGDLVSFNTVSMYEPLSQSWHQQQVSGSKPPGCVNSCVVGLEGDDDTYEIFMYGGTGGAASGIETAVSLSAVYVLSLPSFNWQQTTYTPQYGRWLHSCNIVGNRQMVVVGAIVQTISDYNANSGDTYVSSVDPLHQGLGIFDLSDMEWKEAYNASAASYVTPDVVKSWYSKHGRYPNFSDAVVGSWFTRRAHSSLVTPTSFQVTYTVPNCSLNLTSPGSNTTASNTTSPNSNRTVSSSGSGPHKSDTGAIVGGTIGGILAVLLAAAAAFLTVWRRHRRGSASPDRSRSESHKPELDAESLGRSPIETLDHNRFHESDLPERGMAKDASGEQIYKMPDGKKELSA